MRLVYFCCFCCCLLAQLAIFAHTQLVTYAADPAPAPTGFSGGFSAGFTGGGDGKIYSPSLMFDSGVNGPGLDSALVPKAYFPEGATGIPGNATFPLDPSTALPDPSTALPDPSTALLDPSTVPHAATAPVGSHDLIPEAPLAPEPYLKPEPSSSTE